MKKQELKNDPIRDYIVNAYNYLNDNKNLTYSITAGIIGSLVLFVYLNNQKNELNLRSSYMSGVSQNLFLLSEQAGNDEYRKIALENFNEMLNGEYNKESINQAILYLIKNSMDNNEDIISIINSNHFNSKDVFLNSYYNGIVGDYYSRINEHRKASSYYYKSLENFNDYSDTLIDFKLSYIFSLIQDKEINSAIDEFNSIDYEELSFGSKNKYDIFKNNYSDMLK